jgi:hypothetical protein
MGNRSTPTQNRIGDLNRPRRSPLPLMRRDLRKRGVDACAACTRRAGVPASRPGGAGGRAAARDGVASVRARGGGALYGVRYRGNALPEEGNLTGGRRLWRDRVLDKDILIIGGGVIGCAVARELSAYSDPSR